MKAKSQRSPPQKQQKTRNDKPHHFEPDSFPLGKERSPQNNQIHNLASSKRFVFDSHTSETMRSKKKNPNLRRSPKERETV